MATYTTLTTLIPLFLFLYLSFHIVLAQQKTTNITRGSFLTPTTNATWQSPSGLYAFGFYPRPTGGYSIVVIIAGIPEKTVVWIANRDDPPLQINSTLLLTSDGKLILQGQDKPIVSPPLSISSASMLDSGNFILYNMDGEIMWQSFENPTDTILAGQRLASDHKLVSSTSETDQSSGIFCLFMQDDGHLVQYPIDGPYGPLTSYYSTGTMGAGNNVSLNLDREGSLYLLNGTVLLKNLTTPTSLMPIGPDSIVMLKIDPYGMLRIYSHPRGRGNWSVSWTPPEYDRCGPKGLCGLNGFCVLLDKDPDCKCLPGFDFVKPGTWASGCRRNFVAEGCDDLNRSRSFHQYSMVEVEDTKWEDVRYSPTLSLTKEECKESCLQDCNCEAALFSDGSCTKQRLPLRYGRRVAAIEGSTALIKVGSNSPRRENFVKETREVTNLSILITGVSLTVFAVVVLVLAGIMLYKNRVWANRKISEERSVELHDDMAPRIFSYVELEKITNGFEEELGRGSCGTVFKGILENNQKLVAVKRIDKVLAEGEREFYAEIKVIGKTHHRNLVQLVGYCLEGTNRLLVYEYMSNGSLSDTLFNSETKPDFNERIRIARDIARGILYLHEECETQIIHCDIKPQNILMDDQRCTKISDFGLAKLMRPDQTKTFTGIRGTKGYVAPEWHLNSPITAKADVYSFGIVLMEIVCCRRSFDWSLREEEAALDEWVYECLQAKRVGDLVNDEGMDLNKLERIIRVAVWCVQEEPSLRPSMKKVMLMLEGTMEIPVPPSPTSFLSTV